MPFAFQLPTTSNLSFPLFLSSTTHPSLPFTASTHRGVLRDALKKHKRLPLQTKGFNLKGLMSTLNGYLPYVLALDAGLSSASITGEEIDVVLEREVEVEWRTCLTASLLAREAPRIKGKGLDYEICFALHTLACTYTLSARAQLHTIYSSATLNSDQRTAVITTATKHLLQAHSIHSYLRSRNEEINAVPVAVETIPSVQSGLAALALAEATLLVVFKDDPYPSVVAQNRSKDDKEWMIKAPEIPKVRATLFARLCLAAADHAGKAEAMLKLPGAGRTSQVDDALVRYTNDLKKTSTAKACRFFAIGSELSGETGQGIAWLNGSKKALGFEGTQEEASKFKKLANLKKDWTERREDKKIEKGKDWGGDAGRLEEARVIEMLLQKWNKLNDIVRNLHVFLGCSVRPLTWMADQYPVNTSIRPTNGQHAFRPGYPYNKPI